MRDNFPLSLLLFSLTYRGSADIFEWCGCIPVFPINFGRVTCTLMLKNCGLHRHMKLNRNFVIYTWVLTRDWMQQHEPWERVNPITLFKVISIYFCVIICVSRLVLERMQFIIVPMEGMQLMAPFSNPPTPLQRVDAASSNAVQCLHNMTSAQNAQ